MIIFSGNVVKVFYFLLLLKLLIWQDWLVADHVLKILNSNADFNQFLATSLDKTVPARKEGEMVKRECSKMVDSDHCPLQTFSLLYGYTCP